MYITEKAKLCKVANCCKIKIWTQLGKHIQFSILCRWENRSSHNNVMGAKQQKGHWSVCKQWVSKHFLLPYWGHVLLESLSGEAGHMVDDRGKVGGTPELQLRQTVSVGIHHALYACGTHIHRYSGSPLQHPWATFKNQTQLCEKFKPAWTEGICWIEIDRKLMGHL